MVPVLADRPHRQQGRPGLHRQAAQRRQVPRRHRLQRRGGEGDLRPRDQPGQQAQALQPLQQHRQDRGGRRDHGAHHAEEPFSPFINTLAHPSGVMISPAALTKFGTRTSRSNPVGTGPFKFVEWKADRLPEGRQVRRLLEEGLPEGRHDHLEAGGRQQHARRDDADRRGALRLPDAARSRPRRCKGKPSLEVIAAPSIIHALPVDEHAAEALRQPEGAPGDQLRDQQGSAGQGGVRAATPCRPRACVPKGVECAAKLGPWPYDLAKAQASC